MDAIFSEAHMDVRLQRPVRCQYIIMLYLENTATNEQSGTHIDTQKCFQNVGIAQKIITTLGFRNYLIYTEEKGDFVGNMDRLNWCPTLMGSLKKYNAQKLKKDIGAGIIVAVIALPLSIALAIASGVSPEHGLYSAIIGGFFVSLFSGSRVQIGGVTAATVMTVAAIAGEFGIGGLAVATVMAGVFLIIMGICQAGNLLKYIPITITTGFTAGIAIGIFTGQVKEMLGLTVENIPIRIIGKWVAYAENISTFSLPSFLVGMLSLAILLLVPKITAKIPNTIVMIVVMTAAVKVFSIPVHTVKSIYGELPSEFPKFIFPKFQYEMMNELFIPALTLAFLIAIVSLLSCVVTDGMIGKRHNSNMELVAQGIANIFCGFFAAVPVAGAVARSSASVRNGGKSQVVGIVHSVTVLFILLFLMPLVGEIPMASLAALLMLVAYRMINWTEIYYTMRYAPKSDAIVLLATIAMAVLVDLMAAIEVGLLLAALLFMKRMADVTTVEGWKYAEESDADDIELKAVPKHTRVYEICGPMFFAASEKLLAIVPDRKCKCLILRMRSVTAIDATAMHHLENLWKQCHKQKITIVLSHVNEQPMNIMRKAKFDELIGTENICTHIDEALNRAEEICQ